MAGNKNKGNKGGNKKKNRGQKGGAAQRGEKNQPSRSEDMNQEGEFDQGGIVDDMDFDTDYL